MTQRLSVRKESTNGKTVRRADKRTNSARVARDAKGKIAVKKMGRKTKDKPLTPEQIEALILDHRANARKLSRSILRRWHARLDLQELDSLVDLALCEAARRYNPNKGASFMTFLFYHLRGCLVRAVDAAANVNTIPASDFEIAELSSDYSNDSYKNGAFKAGSANEISDALCNHEYMLPDEQLYKKEMTGLSNVACEHLDDLEREVVYRIYALEQPLVDIARNLGYSRCHISRVKRKALEVLHKQLSPHVGDNKPFNPNFDDDGDEQSARRPISRRKLQRDKLGTINGGVSNISDELPVVESQVG